MLVTRTRFILSFQSYCEFGINILNREQPRPRVESWRYFWKFFPQFETVYLSFFSTFFSTPSLYDLLYILLLPIFIIHSLRCIRSSCFFFSLNLTAQAAGISCSLCHWEFESQSSLFLPLILIPRCDLCIWKLFLSPSSHSFSFISSSSFYS